MEPGKQRSTPRKRTARADGAVERQLMLLIEASGALLESPQSENVLRRILEAASQFIAADGYAVWRKDGSGTVWKLVTSMGLSDEYKRSDAHSGRETSPMLSEPIAIEDVEAFPLLRHRVELYRAE